MVEIKEHGRRKETTDDSGLWLVRVSKDLFTRPCILFKLSGILNRFDSFEKLVPVPRFSKAGGSHLAQSLRHHCIYFHTFVSCHNFCFHISLSLKKARQYFISSCYIFLEEKTLSKYFFTLG